MNHVRRILLENRKIIMDCDPGIDDAVAFAVLLKACDAQLKMVLTTYGNISQENATKNSLTLLALLDADVPVVCGADAPGPGNGVYEDASYIHGGDGIGGLQGSDLLKDIPAREAVEGDYLQIVYDAIMEEESVDYITLGPLTNLSALIRRFPDVIGHIEQVITMGGGINLGNVTELAEFNFYCDAESADHVLSTMEKVILAPIDITTKVNFSLPAIAEIGAAGTTVAKVMEAMLTVNYHQCVGFGEPGATMHDSTAILAYYRPDLFEFRSCGIRVNCEKERYGESVPIGDRDNVMLMVGTQSEKVLEIISRSIIEYRKEQE